MRWGSEARWKWSSGRRRRVGHAEGVRIVAGLIKHPEEAVRANLDVVILTLNEEPNLEYCLRSIHDLARNIFIVDSGSTDRTVEIAKRYDARITSHEFVTQARQFNWALDHLPIESDWVLRLDGDEYVLPALRAEITEVLPKLPPEVTGLYIKRRMVHMGRWIRWGGYYPIWLLRLFRFGAARSEETDLNEHFVLLRGRSARLKHDFVDEDHRGLSAWLIKHEGYAARQGRVLTRLQQGYEPTWIRPKLFGNQAERKRWLIHHVYRTAPLFLRAYLYFLYRYVLLLGFLDGREGLIFHFLHGCWYPFYIDAKLYERRLRGTV
jgi:glycosyltransferase involved in cell wall biosynthesis